MLNKFKASICLMFVMGALFSLSACGSPNDSIENETVRATINVGTLKGPAGIGMVDLMEKNEKGEAKNSYSFSIAGAADEIVAKVISGEVDAAAVPSNMASIIYNKTKGQIAVAAVTTLGVLYVVESGDDIHSVEDLRGKKIYNTGQGAAPQYVLNFILMSNGIDPEKDVEIIYMAEHAELNTAMAAGEVSIGVLPEPNVTALLLNSTNARIALNLTAEWDKACTKIGMSDSLLSMGCLVVNKDFLAENKDAFNSMLSEYEASISYVKNNVQEASLLVEKFGIMPKADIAVKAIPNCNIVYIDGGEMKKSLSNYLNILLDAQPQSIGGSLPDDKFYYTK